MTVLIVAIIVAIAWSVPAVRRRTERKPAVGKVDTAVVLDLAAAALSAGASIPRCLHSVDAALGVSGPYKSLSEVGNLLLLGATWPEAWDGAAPAMWRMREALEPAWRDGAAPLVLLERSAQTLRQTRTRRAKEAAARLGSKLVLPLGLCFLPAFILLGVVPIVVTLAERML